MRLKQLEEAVRYGGREKSAVKSSFKDFKFGFEIELNLPEDLNDDSEEYDSYEEYIVGNDIEIKFNSMAELVPVIQTLVEDGYIKEINDLGIDRITGSSPNPISKSYIDNLHDVLSGINNDSTPDLFPMEYNHAIVTSIVDAITDGGNFDLTRIWNVTSTLYHDREILLSDEIIRILTKAGSTRDIIPLAEFIEDYISTLSSVLGGLQMSISSPSDIPNFGDMDDKDEEMIEMIMEEAITPNLTTLKDTVNAMVEDSNYENLMEYNSLEDRNFGASFAYVKYGQTVHEGITLGNIANELGLGDEHEELISELEMELEDHPTMQDYRTLENDEIRSPAAIRRLFKEIVVANDLHHNVYPVLEADGQIEIITEEPVSGSEIENHYNQMKDIIELLVSRGFYTASNSGLHMSISYKNGSTGINKQKFALLSDIYNITETDTNAIRDYVKNIFHFMEENEHKLLTTLLRSDDNESISQYVIDHVEDSISRVSSEKFQGINFSSYDSMQGRIELRFFGGVDYEDRLDEYYDTLIKFMYILKIASDDTHDKNYYQALNRIVQKAFKKSYNVTIDEARRNIKFNSSLMKKYNLTANEFLDELNNLLSRESSVLKQSKYSDAIRKTLATMSVADDDIFLIDSSTSLALTALEFDKRKNK